MCNGSTSPGNSTVPSGNRGSVSTGDSSAAMQARYGRVRGLATRAPAQRQFGAAAGHQVIAAVVPVTLGRLEAC
jgi:hypothetical protein